MALWCSVQSNASLKPFQSLSLVAWRIGEGVQRQQVQRLRILHLRGKLRMTAGSSRSRRCEMLAMSK